MNPTDLYAFSCNSKFLVIPNKKLRKDVSKKLAIAVAGNLKFEGHKM